MSKTQVQKVRTKFLEEYRIDDFPAEVLPPPDEKMRIYKIRYGRTENIGNCRDYQKGVWQEMRIYITYNQEAIIKSNPSGSITVTNFTDARRLLSNQNKRETLLVKLPKNPRILLERVLEE